MLAPFRPTTSRLSAGRLSVTRVHAEHQTRGFSRRRFGKEVLGSGLALSPFFGCSTSSARGAELRVLSLHDVTTELAVELAAPLVGVREPIELTAAARLPLVGVQRVAGVESILAQHPSVVLGLALSRAQEPDLLAQLSAQGIASYWGQPSSVAAWLQMVRAVGDRVEKQAQSHALVRRLASELKQESRPRERPRRVLVYDCCEPPFAAAGDGLLSELIGLAGGQNVLCDVPGEFAHISWEQAVRRKPELIVVHQYAYGGQGDVAAKRARLAAVPGLKGVATMALPLGCSLGGLRCAEGVRLLRQSIERLG